MGADEEQLTGSHQLQLSALSPKEVLGHTSDSDGLVHSAECHLSLYSTPVSGVDLRDDV